MPDKKLSGTERLVTIAIVVWLVLSTHLLFSDSPSVGSSDDQHQY